MGCVATPEARGLPEAGNGVRAADCKVPDCESLNRDPVKSREV